MTLHIFNPEHDIALAQNLSNFTAPHAARQLRRDFGFLPAMWAGDGDAVLVDDVDYAVTAWRRVASRLRRVGIGRGVSPVFVGKQQLKQLRIDAIAPWGWNRALWGMLLRWGVDLKLMPSFAGLDTIRELSHRRESARLLARLQGEGTVGEAFECTSVGQIDELLTRHGSVVLKAPWSSSGRGLRFLSADQRPSAAASQRGTRPLLGTPSVSGWVKNVLAAQGSVMVEPFYRKVKDFGMEFRSDGVGGVSYEGLSLFHTVNGAYTGNVVATEQAKREWLAQYLPLSLVDRVREQICHEMAQQDYRGPFGVDMMVVAGEDEDGFRLHPCVEVNLRRTMGHVALALTPADDDLRLVMRMEYADNYKLKLHRL